jgi:beta-lactamase regulating signal transducer with metallopeptidase domain
MGIAFLIDVSERATLLVLTAMAAALLLRRAPAALRRRLWAGTLIGLLLFPALVSLLPRWPVPVLTPPRPAPWTPTPLPPSELPPAPASLTAAPATVLPRSSRSWGSPVLWVYGAGVLVSLVGLGRARRRAHRALRSAVPAGPHWAAPREIDARESEEVALPSMLGAWRPVVLLPTAGRQWPAEWRRAVLAHEVAHVRMRDGLAQLLAEVARALYWFHPLVHLAARQLRVERELAADDHALAAAGVAPSAYAELLFELACVPDVPAQLGAVVPLLTPAGLKARVASILDGRRARAERTPAVVALAVLGLAALGSAAAAVPGNRTLGHGRGPVIARVTDGGPAADVEVVVSLATPPRRSAVVRTDGHGEVRYPADLPDAQYYDVYARRGRLAARAGIMAVPFGTPLPVELALHPASTISGHARDERGAAIAGATVEILEDETTAPGPGRQVLARTDGTGRWQIDGLLYGRYALLVRAPWGVATMVPAQVQASDLDGLEAIVPGQWPITAYVRDPQGHPAAGIRVEHPSVWGMVQGGGRTLSRHRLPGERYLDWDETAADGSFRLLPRDGRLIIATRTPEGGGLFAQLEQGRHHHPTTPPPIVTLQPTVRVSGVVRTPDGRPVPGASVRALQSMWFHATGLDEAVITDAQGRYVLPAVPPVTITLEANVHATGPQAAPDGRVTLLLRPGESPHDIDITLVRQP